jgi:hypothetical protein
MVQVVLLLRILIGELINMDVVAVINVAIMVLVKIVPIMVVIYIVMVVVVVPVRVEMVVGISQAIIKVVVQLVLVMEDVLMQIGMILVVVYVTTLTAVGRVGKVLPALVGTITVQHMRTIWDRVVSVIEEILQQIKLVALQLIMEDIDSVSVNINKIENQCIKTP